jgi:hypothetical protein
MNLTRRGFFGATLGAIAAAAMPKAWLRAPSGFQALTYRGVPFVFDENCSPSTVMGINRATFSFWRNQQADGNAYDLLKEDHFKAAMTTAYNQCERMT